MLRYFPPEREDETDLGFGVLGRAITLANLFETSLVGVASTLQGLDVGRAMGLNMLEDADTYGAIVAKFQRQTLDSNLKYLGKLGVEAPLSDILDSARTARNQLVHEVPYTLVWATLTASDLQATLAEIRRLTRQVATGLVWIEHSSEPPGERIAFGAIPSVVDRLVEWVCDP